jgi:hypothetical protein
MKSGSSATARASDSFWRPIAPIIRFRFPISCEMSGLLCASAPESRELSTIRRSRVRSSYVSSAKTRREVERKGFR